MHVTRILHASVNAQGRLDETRRFYEEVMGLTAAPRPEISGVPGVWYTVGDSQVHVIGAAPAGAGIDPVGNHYCLAVDDLEGALAELKAAGVEYFRVGPPPDGREVAGVQAWFVDPAGNTVELQQESGALRP